MTAALLRWGQRNGGRVLTVSRVQCGALGFRGVALSLPTVVGQEGASRVLEPELSASEHEAILKSADILETAWNSMGLEKKGVALMLLRVGCCQRGPNPCRRCLLHRGKQARTFSGLHQLRQFLHASQLREIDLFDHVMKFIIVGDEFENVPVGRRCQLFGRHHLIEHDPVISGVKDG